MEKNINKRNIEDEKPPDYNEVCPPLYADAVYLPNIKIQIRKLIQNIVNEEEDERIYQELKEKKELLLMKKQSSDRELINEEEEHNNTDENAVDYEKIVNSNNQLLKELNQEISELSNTIKVLFNEIEIITANPNIHSKGKLYKLTYFIRNYIPIIKERFKKFRNRHFEDETLEKIRSQIYFSFKLYFDIVLDYFRENYEVKLGDEKIENYDQK